MSSPTGDRRPIASRNLAIWQHTAAFLARLHISANAISIAGMFAGLTAGAALFFSTCHGSLCLTTSASRLLLLAAAALIQLRLLANMLDGMVAIASNQASRLGELFNEIPDRISNTAILAGAGYAATSHPTLGWAAAVVALFVTYIRALAKGTGVPGLFHGPMAKSHRMFTMTLTCLYAALAPRDFQPLISLSPYQPPVGIIAFALLAIILGGLLTAYRRLRALVIALREKP